jgi:hypothetical protein
MEDVFGHVGGDVGGVVADIVGAHVDLELPEAEGEPEVDGGGH